MPERAASSDDAAELRADLVRESSLPDSRQTAMVQRRGSTVKTPYRRDGWQV